jgi:arylsulfatase A-like enzyme/Tfp pilus assembly protein PilF
MRCHDSRIPPAFITLTILLLFAACSKRPEPVAEKKPTAAAPKLDVNVLLITLDTLRADYVSCYGSKKVSTPAIDALAARGVRFAQAIAQVPLTTPSHASILTGTYPQVHGVRDIGGFVLEKDVPTIASVVGQAGYDTAAFVGSAVLNHHYGLDRGFATYNDQMKAESSVEKLPGVVAEVRGDVVTRRTLDWLDKHHSPSPGKKFFVWAHYYDPHFPYDPPEPYRSRYSRDLYAGEAAYTDAQVGKLIGWLSEADLLDHTLVVLLADHGESLGEHGEYTHGVFLYDSTVHIPMIVAGPGIPSGRVVPQQVRSIDVEPTIADLLGLPAGDKTQGVSLKSSLMEGREPRSNYCYMETLYPKTSHGWSELRGMRTDEWKLIVAPKPELYRFSDDPVETKNVIVGHPADADRLQKKVWEVAGPPQSLGKLEPKPVDDERRRELDALGYVSSGRAAIYIDMSGPDPKDRVATLGMLERASDAMNHDRWQEGAAMLEKALRSDPTNPLIYKELQACYENSRQFEKMEKTCLLAIKNKAAGDGTYADLGEIYVRRGDLQRAIEYMETAARMNPAKVDNLNNMATAYLHLGQLAEAERALKAVLAQDARNAMGHNLYGILEIQRSQPIQARQQFELALASDASLAEPYMNLGLIAQNSGDTQAAIKYYKGFLQRADKVKHREVIPKVEAALSDLSTGR